MLRQAPGLLLLLLGIVWAIWRMSAEVLLAEGFKTRNLGLTAQAIKVYPFLRYVDEGLARQGVVPEMERILRKDPKAYDIAAALRNIQLIRR